VVGREPELAAVREWIDAPSPTPALVLTGPAGIGKTTLWEAGVAIARDRAWTVLVSRASEAEVELSFAGLTDLLDAVGASLVAKLQAPQRRALEVALARAEPVGAPPEPLAIAAALLNLLRDESLGDRVLIAVDDAQWLDRASAAALAFASRRVLGERVRLLLTVRADHSSALERAVPARRLEVSAMTMVEAQRLLSEQLGLSVPRPLMSRLVETAQGNPLVVLELGRLLLERGTLELGTELPVPELAGELFGARVQALPTLAGDALLVAALSGQLTRAELAGAAEPAGIDEGVAYGVLVLDGDRVRASHPLHAAAAREHAPEHRRREVHLKLARVLGDEERAARHLALATVEPDADRAAVVAAAAAAGRHRGATRDAADLAEHAARLTPDGDPAEVERLLTLAEYLMSAGELQRLRELLEAGVDELPPGAPRALAHMLLADCSDQAGHVAHLELAIAESPDHAGLRAAALASKVMLFAVLLVERIVEAEGWAEEGLQAARSAGPDAERRALSALAWTRALRGVPVDDLERRFGAGYGSTSLYEASVERVVAVRHEFRGELAKARSIFERLLSVADERGETISSEVMRLHLCEVALRSGDCHEVRRALEDAEQWATLDELVPARMRCQALLATLTGDVDHARDRAAASLAIVETDGWDTLEIERALGIVALFARAPEEAVEHLQAVWKHTESEGIAEPGAFPVAPDLVHALIELGRTDEAAAIASTLRALAEAQDHPWGLATATRCEAIVELASHHSDSAAEALTMAADAYGELGLAFDRARTLLALGSAERRNRKWGAARGSLESAANEFERLGCIGWAEQARSELERVGARRPAGEGKLTSAEERVVALAADGLSNKEIAATLVVTVHTVEVHLSHAYTKLGVRSRRQLAQAMTSLG
jgi:DNA-binding NarL/FixJ family response regulator